MKKKENSVKKRHFIIHATFFTGTKITKSECSLNLNLVVVVGGLGRYQRGTGFDSISSLVFTRFRKEKGKRATRGGKKSRTGAGAGITGRAEREPRDIQEL